MWVKVTFINIAVSQLLYDRYLSKFHRNDGNAVGDKNVISAHLENVGQADNLQKSYLGFYTAHFNQQLLIPTHWRSLIGFRMVYLHLILTDSEGQNQGHAHFYCEYLVNDDR